MAPYRQFSNVQNLGDKKYFPLRISRFEISEDGSRETTRVHERFVFLTGYEEVFECKRKEGRKLVKRVRQGNKGGEEAQGGRRCRHPHRLSGSGDSYSWVFLWRYGFSLRVCIEPNLNSKRTRPPPSSTAVPLRQLGRRRRLHERRVPLQVRPQRRPPVREERVVQKARQRVRTE